MDAGTPQLLGVGDNACVFNPTCFCVAFLHVSRNLWRVKRGIRKSSTANCGFRKIVLNPENDLKSLWQKSKALGLTYGRAAGLLEKKWLGKWGVSTVRDAVQGRGGEARENQLRVTLKEFLSCAESVNDGRAESATSPLELKETSSEYGNKDLLRRAEKAEAENAKLKQAIRALLGDESETPPASYSKPK